jgi:hypothetical protein
LNNIHLQFCPIFLRKEKLLLIWSKRYGCFNYTITIHVAIWIAQNQIYSCSNLNLNVIGYFCSDFLFEVM